MPQAPLLHFATAFGGAGHTVPQPPQFLVSVSLFTSQPLP